MDPCLGQPPAPGRASSPGPVRPPSSLRAWPARDETKRDYESAPLLRLRPTTAGLLAGRLSSVSGTS